MSVHRAINIIIYGKRNYGNLIKFYFIPQCCRDVMCYSLSLHVMGVFYVFHYSLIYSSMAFNAIPLQCTVNSLNNRNTMRCDMLTLTSKLPFSRSHSSFCICNFAAISSAMSFLSVSHSRLLVPNFLIMWKANKVTFSWQLNIHSKESSIKIWVA